MAFPRFDLYPPKAQHLAQFARTIGHPERLQIIEMLTIHRELTVSDIVRMSPLSLPTVSQHIAILRREDLLKFRTETPYIWYALNKELLTDHAQRMNLFLAALTGYIDHSQYSAQRSTDY